MEGLLIEFITSQKYLPTLLGWREKETGREKKVTDTDINL